MPQMSNFFTVFHLKTERPHLTWVQPFTTTVELTFENYNFPLSGRIHYMVSLRSLSLVLLIMAVNSQSYTNFVTTLRKVAHTFFPLVSIWNRFELWLDGYSRQYHSVLLMAKAILGTTQMIKPNFGVALRQWNGRYKWHIVSSINISLSRRMQNAYKNPSCLVIVGKGHRNESWYIQWSCNLTNEPLVAFHINHTVKCSGTQTKFRANKVQD